MDLDIKSFCAVQGAQLISLKIKFRETWINWLDTYFYVEKQYHVNFSNIVWKTQTNLPDEFLPQMRCS